MASEANFVSQMYLGKLSLGSFLKVAREITRLLGMNLRVANWRRIACVAGRRQEGRSLNLMHSMIASIVYFVSVASKQRSASVLSLS